MFAGWTCGGEIFHFAWLPSQNDTIFVQDVGAFGACVTGSINFDSWVEIFENGIAHVQLRLDSLGHRQVGLLCQSSFSKSLQPLLLGGSERTSIRCDCGRDGILNAIHD